MTCPVFELGETNIICTDADRSLRFYKDLLGFEYVEQDHGAHRLRSGSAFLLLLPIAAESRKKTAYGAEAAVSFDLAVEDLAETYQYLQDNGVDMDDIRTDEGYFIIRDPDGLALEIVEKDRNSP